MKTHGRFWMSGLAMAGMVLGCGKGDEATTSQRGYRDANVVEQASLQRGDSKSEVVPAVSSPAGEMAVTQIVADSSTPPDLLAKASKELVSRGETVDIIAEGSPDVVDMILSDGYGTTQAMVFDASTGTWRTAYRVPLKMQLDRLGLSIVAHNDEDRWRRVWVFLSLPENSVKADTPETIATPDSASQ